MKRGVLDHPKLARLARLLGVRLAEARGLLENLLDWSYYQAIRGDVGKWADDEIAFGARYEGQTPFVPALIEAGWLDRHALHRLVIHDLDQHADDAWRKQIQRRSDKGLIPPGFANRDEETKPRRRGGQRPDNDRQQALDKDRTLPACPVLSCPEEPSLVHTSARAPDGSGPEDFVAMWNANRGPLGKAGDLSDQRRKHLRARLGERSLDEWATIVRRIAASSFCRGDGDRGWRASFSWLIESPEPALKVLEGKYDNPPPRTGRTADRQPTGPRIPSATEIRAAQDAEVERKRREFEQSGASDIVRGLFTGTKVTA